MSKLEWFIVGIISFLVVVTTYSVLVLLFGDPIYSSFHSVSYPNSQPCVCNCSCRGADQKTVSKQVRIPETDFSGCSTTEDPEYCAVLKRTFCTGLCEDNNCVTGCNAGFEEYVDKLRLNNKSKPVEKEEKK